MLITLKPHSSLSEYFSDNTITVDIDSLSDIPRYLDTMQPKFFSYIRKQKANNLEEGYVFLDKNLRELTYDDLLIRQVRDGDIIYIVPAIFGGGGKRGGLLAIFALVAFFAFFPIGAGVAGAGASAGASAGAAAAGTGTAAGSVAGKGLLAKLPSFLQSIVINAGLALLSSLFTKKPDDSDKASRQNDMFGSLKNSTSSDTPVALHYGQVRVAGQLVSGYIQTINNAKNETVSVAGVIDGLTYGGGKSTGKGVGSFMLAGTSFFDRDRLANVSDPSAYSEYTSPDRIYAVYAFSGTENSLAVYKAYGDTFLGYSADATFLASVTSPVLYSQYAGADPNFIYAVTPTYNSLVVLDISRDYGSVVSAYTDNNNLQGANSLALDTQNDIAYVASTDSNTLSSLSISNPYAISLIDSVTVTSADYVAFNSLTHTVYVASSATNSISAYSSNDGVLTLLSTVTSNTNLLGISDMVLDEANDILLVAAKDSNKIVFIDVSDPTNIVLAEQEIPRDNVIGLALVPGSGRTKFASIAEGSNSIRVHDLYAVRFGVYFAGRFYYSYTSATTSGACTSISSTGPNLVVTIPSKNTVEVYNYSEVTVTIDQDEGPDTTETTRQLTSVYKKQDNDFLIGASSAVITGG